MDIKKLVRIQDSVSREDKFMKDGKLTKEELDNLVNDFSVDDIPVYIEPVNEEVDTRYLSGSVSIGEWQLALRFAFSAYLDPKTKKVQVDMDDDSGNIRDENYNNAGDKDLYFKVLDNVRKKLQLEIQNNLEEYLKKNRKYKKYFK